MHQALYRKWRPKTFDEVCGQEHITSVLKYEVSEGRVSHAYLFCGSRGTGKTTCAKLLAKAVNCLSPIDGNPCGKCAACTGIDSGTATDVLEMDAASNNGVDYIRDIRDEVMYSPAELRYRVYIVDEVHMLSAGAFNALLKTLEEPPAHVIFILATTELHKLPATIISRCQRFDFRRIASQVISSRLLHISEEESISLDPAASSLIAKLSRGGMRDAISMLELCSGVPGKITPETVSDAVGVSSRESVVSLVRAVGGHDIGKCFDIIADISASSVDISIFWQSLTEFYRDMLVIKSTKNAASYLELLPSEEEECRAAAGLFTRERLVSHAAVLDDAAARMQRNSASRRLTAELALVRMCDGSLDASPDALASRISELEEKLSLLSSGVMVQMPSPASDAALNEKAEDNAEKSGTQKKASSQTQNEENAPQESKKEAKASGSDAGTPSAEPEKKVLKALSAWPETLDRISGKNKAIGSFLTDAAAFSDGDVIIIRIGNRFFADMLSSQDNIALIADALSVTLGFRVEPRNVKIDFSQKKGPADKNNENTADGDIISRL